MSQVNIEDFINKHLVKVLWGVAVYFIMTLSNDFKEVKGTLQQLVINQATNEVRVTSTEALARQNAADIRDIRERYTKNK